MRKETITLAGNQYVISERKRKANAKWREKFQAEFTEIADLLQESYDTEMTPQAVGEIVRKVVARVGGSVDRMGELVFDYCPDLGKDKAHLEEEAYDSEIMDAFIAVLKLAYPFGSLVEVLAGLGSIGQAAPVRSES